MTFIFANNFSVLFYLCLNRTESSHILHKHADTEDIRLTSGSSKNNLIYAFLLEKFCFFVLFIAKKMN